MELWIAWLGTVLFGYFAFTSLYAGLKHYKKGEEKGFDDVFSYDYGILAFMGIFFEFILWVSEKLFPQRFHLIVFRIVAISISFLMLGVVYLFWYFYFNFD